MTSLETRASSSAIDQGAVIEGDHRYHLWRQFDPLPYGEWLTSTLWIMLNPSTADATTDDATIRKCVGFTKRLHGHQRIDVVNLFSFRARSPEVLWKNKMPNGDRADEQLEKVLGCSFIRCAVVAWGGFHERTSTVQARVSHVRRLLKDANMPTYCLGTTKYGSPLHPLYLGYARELQPWPKAS